MKITKFIIKHKHKKMEKDKNNDKKQKNKTFKNRYFEYVRPSYNVRMNLIKY